MRQTTKVLTALAIACGASLADQITIRNIPYANVRVTGAVDRETLTQVLDILEHREC